MKRHDPFATPADAAAPERPQPQPETKTKAKAKTKLKPQRLRAEEMPIPPRPRPAPATAAAPSAPVCWTITGPGAAATPSLPNPVLHLGTAGFQPAPTPLPTPPGAPTPAHESTTRLFGPLPGRPCPPTPPADAPPQVLRAHLQSHRAAVLPVQPTTAAAPSLPAAGLLTLAETIAWLRRHPEHLAAVRAQTKQPNAPQLALR